MKGFLWTTQLSLNPVELDDLDILVEWRNHPENWPHFFNKFPLSRSGQNTWFQQLLQSKTKKHFIIVLANGSKIGCIGLDNIDHINQSAEYGNLLIGDKKSAGKGYAKTASILLLEYCFLQLNLKKVYLKVFESNNKAIDFYNKLGFKVDGVLRNEIFSQGKFNNVTLMSILREEFPL